jgi:hypothetical protein
MRWPGAKLIDGGDYRSMLSAPAARQSPTPILT